MSWNLDQLEALLQQQPDLVVTREVDCLLIANNDGLDAWLAISGEQIRVESLLFAVEEVTDTNVLNEVILRTHQLFPLTAVGVSNVAGTDYYLAFGALSAHSDAETVIIEINTLFQNVEGFLSAYQDHLK